jgi:hypothetical protein
MSAAEMDFLAEAFLVMNPTVTAACKTANHSLLAAYRTEEQAMADATTKIRQLHLALAWARTTDEIGHILSAAGTVISRLQLPESSQFYLDAIDCLCQAANIRRDHIRARVRSWLTQRGYPLDIVSCDWSDFQREYVLRNVNKESPAFRCITAAYSAEAESMMEAAAEAVQARTPSRATARIARLMRQLGIESVADANAAASSSSAVAARPDWLGMQASRTSFSFSFAKPT